MTFFAKHLLNVRGLAYALKQCSKKLKSSSAFASWLYPAANLQTIKFAGKFSVANAQISS